MEPTEIKNISWRDIKDIYDLLLQDELVKLFKLTPRETAIVKMRWEGKNFNEIGKVYHISRERIRQLYEKSIRRIKNKISNVASRIQKYNEVLDENEKLQNEIRFYKKRFNRLEEKEKEIFSPIYKEIFNPIFQTSIYSIDFPVRAINLFRGQNIKTIGDLMEYKQSDLLKFEYMGKKTLWEIETILRYQFGLKLRE